jgi:hypothetical protein
MPRRFRSYIHTGALLLCAAPVLLSSCISFDADCRKHRLLHLSKRDTLPVYPFTVSVGEMEIEEAWTSDVLTEVEEGGIIRHEEECWEAGLGEMSREVLTEYLGAVSNASSANDVGPGGWPDYQLTGRIVEMVTSKGGSSRVAMRLSLHEGNPGVRAERAIMTRLYVDSAAPRNSSFMDIPVAYSHAIGRIARRVLHDIDSLHRGRSTRMTAGALQELIVRDASATRELRVSITGENRRGRIVWSEKGADTIVYTITRVAAAAASPAAELTFAFEQDGSRIPGSLRLGTDPKRCEIKLFRNGVQLHAVPAAMKECRLFMEWRAGLELR